MNPKYEPSFLVSANIENDDAAFLRGYAAGRKITMEEALRDAVKFFAAQCVHTHKAARRKSSKPAS